MSRTKRLNATRFYGTTGMKGQREKVYVGTSGYSYFWNPGKPTPFRWYLTQGFNSVEINASFYRFPTPSWAKAWTIAPDGFEFSIKVHRSITHYAKLGGKAEQLWTRFLEPLKPIERRVSFWLFQMPPNYVHKSQNVDRVRKFVKLAGLGNKAVFEFRHPSWWKGVKDVRDAGAAFCSVDGPELPREILTVNDVVYLRLHGREVWYNYVYSEEELDEFLSKVISLKASKKAIYLNNDPGMLENGIYLLKKLAAPPKYDS